jgi:hypothetical protein
VNISSAQGSYSITSSDSVTVELGGAGGTGVIAQDISLVYPDVITLPSGSYDNTITIDGSVFSNIWVTTIPFENGFPEWDDFQNMCKEYPGLEQAYEKLKTFYVLCKDEWDHKQKGQK